MEITQNVGKVELVFFHAAFPTNVLYQCVKIKENPLSTLRVMFRTIFVFQLNLTKGNTSISKQG
jgi:hypothetical protein